MAPEQILGLEPGQATADIYSLGAILYELFTGHQPYRGQTPVESLLLTIQQDPPSPRTLDSTVPFDLETICMKCLEREPGKRYETAEILADDLDRWLEGKAVLARRPSPRERLTRWAHRHRFALRTAAVVVLIGTISLAALQNERADHAEARQRAESEARAALALQNYYTTIALVDRERAAGNSGHAERLLDQCPEALRGWEWDYLRRQRYGQDAPRLHTSHLFCLALAADERLFAAGGSDGSILLGDPARNEPFASFKAHSQQVRGVAISPDNTLLASAGFDGWVRLWGVQTRRCMHEWSLGGVALSVAFSPRGDILVASTGDESGIRRWEVKSGQVLSSFTGFGGVIRKIAFRPDGRDLAAGNDLGRVVVWDTATGTINRSFSAHEDRIFDVQYSTSGQQLVTAAGQFYMQGNLGEVKIWDTETGELKRAIQSPNGAATPLAFPPTVVVSLQRARMPWCGFGIRRPAWNLSH